MNVEPRVIPVVVKNRFEEWRRVHPEWERERTRDRSINQSSRTVAGRLASLNEEETP